MAYEKEVHVDRTNGKEFHDPGGFDDKAVVSHEERMHWGHLTDDELVIEKRLRRKIDALIMPLVILVYLMNYIDRWDIQCCIAQKPHTNVTSETTTPLLGCKVLRRICIYTATSIRLDCRFSLLDM